MSEPREIIVLGSTGSIGTQALDVVRRHPDRLRVVGLGAGGADIATVAAQAAEFGVATVAVARSEIADEMRSALSAAGAAAQLLVGPDAATELAGAPCDVVLNGITGSIGLRPTLAALQAGHTLALANKESLIAGGELVTKAAAPGQLVPVDSEHSALAQALRGGRPDEVRRLVLTASGGPFRGRSRAELGAVTLEDALAHPTWSMGRDITINSATLVNKGLELIEAHLLFDVPLERIEVVVHPQSVVHSMVEFVDGSTLAQASPPTMLIPIALALAWPDRLPDVAPACDWSAAATWDFLPLDREAFPSVELARAAAQRGGLAPAVYNAANEECIHAFAAGRLSFLAIVDAVEQVLGEYRGGNATSVDDVLAAELWARARAREIAGVGRRAAGTPESPKGS